MLRVMPSKGKSAPTQAPFECRVSAALRLTAGIRIARVPDYVFITSDLEIVPLLLEKAAFLGHFIPATIQRRQATSPHPPPGPAPPLPFYLKIYRYFLE